MVAYSFKRRFIVPISLGLGVPYDIDFIDDLHTNSRPKWQTIRAHRQGRGRHAHEGEMLQLYYAQRSPQHGFKIGESPCTLVEPIVIKLQKKGRRRESIRLPNMHYDSIDGLDDFASMDGFRSWHAMAEFWDIEHPGVTDFSGTLVRWKPGNLHAQA